MVILSAIAFNVFSYRLHFHSIDVLMQPIKNVVQEFRRVLLTIAPKHSIEFAYCPFDGKRVESVVGFIVEVAQQLGILLSQLALAT